MAKVVVMDNFLNVLDDEVVTDLDAPDTRTAIYCRNHIDDDPATYINYMQVLHQLLRNSKTPKFGPVYMFRLGYLPVCCPPSFWTTGYAEQVLPKIREAGLHLYPREPFCVSYYGARQRGEKKMPDWWVSKIDVMNLTGKKNIVGITVQEVYRLCGILPH